MRRESLKNLCWSLEEETSFEPSSYLRIVELGDKTPMELQGCSGQFYEDKRCRCICPSPSVVFNNSLSNTRTLFIANVPPNKCNCDEVILQHVTEEVRARQQEFCPRCECKYETRNTTVIMVVVVMVLWMLMLLFVYMGFLLCLDPLIKRKRVKCYREEEGGEEACKLLIQGEDED